MAQLEARQIAEFGLYFKDHLTDYSVIGGAATLLYLEERLPGRHGKATKDLDIAVLDISPNGKESAFLSRFKKYIDEMGYEFFVGKTNEVHAYRFVNPKKELAPSKIEIATRQIDGLGLKSTDAQRLTEYDISAIVCDPLYIEHLRQNSEPKQLSGTGGGHVNIAKIGPIILMKSLAYINLIVGDAKSQDHANRHAADIIRLSGILIDSDRIQVSAELWEPLEKLFAMKEKAFQLNRIAVTRGKGIDADRVIADIQKFISKI